MEGRARLHVRWLFILAALFCGQGCMRSLPRHFRMPAPHARADIRVQGLAPAQIWKHLLTPSDLTGKNIDRLAQWMQIEQEITGFPLVAGNRVQLLLDGPMTFSAMFAAMRHARHSIHVETFILSDDEVGRKFADILIERRRAGVEVRMVVDAIGAWGADTVFLDRMRRAGIEISIYHPLDDVHLWRINTRHHRKLLIVDGRIAFIGGINICKVYARDSFRDPNRIRSANEAWRDTDVKVQGPAVTYLQELFVSFWAGLHETAPLSGPPYFPALPEQGHTLVRVADSIAVKNAHAIYRLYIAAFRHARKTIWITQGYFSPDDTFLEALKRASRRGVDVRILLPGLTDSWLTISSSRAHYEELLKAGVRIFERKDVLQHAKTAVIDGMWSIVGSTNLDNRSFMHDNEADVIMWGRDFGAMMQVLFLYDQGDNQEITLSQWRKRPIYMHFLESLATLFNYWL
jgi:cardiolipin synthase